MKQRNGVFMKRSIHKLASVLGVLSLITGTVVTPEAKVMASANTSTGAAIVEDTKPVSTPQVTATPAPEAPRKDAWTVKLKKVSHPKKLTKGAGFTVKGTLKASKKMQVVKASILDDEGKELYSKKIKVNKKNCSLKKVDSAMKFSNLKEGNYSYVVQATNKQNDTKTVIDDDFKVKKPKWTTPVKGGDWGDGWHCHCSSHRGKHFGWDASGGGRTIYSVSDGKVVYAKYHSASSLASFGNLIIIYHGKGIYSYYAHCKSIKVKVGQKVSVGDKIGVTGSTGYAFGAHLHFELRKGPAFDGDYNDYKLVDKYTYKQFNPAKKIKR